MVRGIGKSFIGTVTEYRARKLYKREIQHSSNSWSFQQFFKALEQRIYIPGCMVVQFRMREWLFGAKFAYFFGFLRWEIIVLTIVERNEKTFDPFFGWHMITIKGMEFIHL